jgi:hypothetical protein
MDNYGPRYQAIAERVIIKAADELFAEGFSGVEAAHGFIKAGLEYIAVACCREHQLIELAHVVDAVQARLDELRGATH